MRRASLVPSLCLSVACLLPGAAGADTGLPAASYTVRAGPGARELHVEASFSRAAPSGLVFDDGMGRHARDVEVARGRSWRAVGVTNDVLVAPECAGGCRVRYRFALAEAAPDGRGRGAAFAQDGSFVAAPSVWLLRPPRRPAGRYRLRVTTEGDVRFATGLFRGAGGDYEAPLADLPEAPYSAFGPFVPRGVAVPGGEVEVAVLGAEVSPGMPALLRWVEAAAQDVAAYYGRFPVPRALVLVIPGGRRAVGYGTTMGNGGASIMIWVGPGAREEDLRRDWVLTHEMVHFGLPNLPRAQRWMEEGLATYVEPIARARRGRLGVADLWTDIVRRTPQGLPGEGGLDAHRGFGPVYWGGALFWLMADVEIREKTGGRRSLEDALRGIRDKGGSIAVTWDVPRALRAGDDATGVRVLEPLFARLARSAEAVDLPALWSRLGIEDAGGLRFRDDAPLASVRRAITAPTPPSGTGSASRGEARRSP